MDISPARRRSCSTRSSPTSRSSWSRTEARRRAATRASASLPHPRAVVGAVRLERPGRGEPADGAATVLAIDDDPTALELVRATLEPRGFRVLKAFSGQEGLEVAKRRQPDLIVLDLVMPGLDGFEVSKALKDDPETASIPIVVLTFQSLSSAEKHRLSSRIAHLGEKSEFNRKEFVGLVRAAIGKKASG